MPKLFIALDGLSAKETETWKTAEALAESGLPFGFKVNLDYLLTAGLGPVVNRIHDLKREIFADLKMWNGARTMMDVLRTLERLHVEIVTVHAVGDTELKKAIEALGPHGIKVLATTILTHYDHSYCLRHFGRGRPEAVLHFAETARQAGADGIVLPGAYLVYTKTVPLLRCVPGIRIRTGGAVWDVWDGRHEVETTPELAASDGADIVVCGSPIMKADDPILAARRILQALGTELEA